LEKPVNMDSPTEENYLKALFKLSDEKGHISISELSAAMNVSMPTANSMVKKLDAQGWLKYEKYKPLTITAKGRKKASLIIRKHRLTEMFLVEKMGFTWENVHEIAEQVEHVQSEAFFDRMDELLGYPKIDPHGSPIPDKDGKTEDQHLILLSQCASGQAVTLRALTQSDVGLLNFLTAKSIMLGTELKIISKEPYDGSLRVAYGEGQQETLSQVITEKLMVELSE
jgi:DtxR family Mn-dependent transcriptional regulator